MRKIAIALAFGAAIASFPLAGSAASATAPAASPDFTKSARQAPLSLEAAIAIALVRNPEYQSTREGVPAAAAQVRETRSPSAPTLQVRDALLYADPVAKLATPFGALPFATTTTTDVPLLVIAYQVFDGGASAARFSQAAAGLAAAEARERQARSGLADAATKAYFDLEAALRLAEVATQSVDVAHDRVKQAEQLFAAGQIPQADVLSAETELANENVGAIGAANAVSLAQTNLAGVLNVPLDSTFDPTDPLDGDAPAFDLASLLAAARDQRGELAAARAGITAAERAVDEARAGKAPSLNAFVSNGNTQPAVVPGYHNQISAGLNLVWTLFDGGYTAGRIDAADAGVRQATLALQQVENGVELEVRQAYLNVGQASAQVDASRQLVALAEENQRLAQVRYRGGVGTALELQDAELRADAARETLVGAEVALREGVSHLRFAAGML